MPRTEGGFSLVELVLVLALIVVISAVAAPYMLDLIRETEPKRAARELAGVLREVRAQAIKLNTPRSVDLNLDTNTYTWLNPKAGDKEMSTVFPASLKMATADNGTECGVTSGTTTITFFADGSGTQRYICMLNKSGNTPRYRVGFMTDPGLALAAGTVDQQRIGKVFIQRRVEGAFPWR